MARYSALRASDADRENVADRLREAAAEGRLLAEELEHRVAATLRARTYGELDAVVADLPAKSSARRSSRPVARALLAVAIGLAALVVVAFVAAVLIGIAAVWALFALLFWGRRGRYVHRQMLHRHAHLQLRGPAQRGWF